MPDYLQVILIVLVVAALGYGVYRYTRKSGSESVGGRVGPGGKPDWDADKR